MKTEPREKVGTDAVKNAVTRRALEAELTELAEMKVAVDGYTNSKKTGTMDLLKANLLLKFKKLGLDGKSLLYDGFRYANVVGSSSGFAEKNIRKALMDYGIDPDIQEAIISQSRSTSTFETLQVSAVKEEE